MARKKANETSKPEHATSTTAASKALPKMGREAAIEKAYRDKSLSGLDLSQVDFSGVDFRAVSFVGSDLTGAMFEGAVLQGCDFRGAKTTEWQFDNSDTRWAVWR